MVRLIDITRVAAAWPLLLLPALAGAAPGRWTPVTLIDFSSKHDILIRSDDGTLTPMDVPYHHAKLIAPGTWQVESDGDYSYLIEGDTQALAIDSGYGAGNLRTYLQTLTTKPVRFVANTHYHFDHTANDAYFDRAFMSADTAAKATIPYPSFAGMTFPRDYPKTIIGDGYIFHLGHRDIEAFVVPNHTPGGTVYLDRKQRILFSGDEAMGAHEPLNISVAQFAANMRKLEAHRGEFDRLAGGPGIMDAPVIDGYLAAAQAVLGGAEGMLPPPRPRGPGGPGQAELSSAPAGTIVYQRRRVRGPDRPPEVTGPPNPDLRVMQAGDVQISYDRRRIQS